MAGMMDVPANPENLELARRVAARMAADSRIVNAKAAFWRLLGIGGLLFLVGLGVAAAIYAYSCVADVSTSADKIAEALVVAFERAPIKTEGVVTLNPDARVALADNRLTLENAQVGLAPGASVTLRDGGLVGLRPGGTVGVTGAVQANVTGQAPQVVAEDTRKAVNQLRAETGSGGDVGRNGSKIMRSITTFQEVAYGSGKVVTGWNWGSSNDPAPSQQYCYYDQGTQGASIRIDLARDGREVPVTRAPRGFQAQEAAANCVWFNGAQTQKKSAFE
jgi:hypothetical protein